jgi:SAM-dependent methyltransferase
LKKRPLDNVCGAALRVSSSGRPEAGPPQTLSPAAFSAISAPLKQESALREIVRTARCEHQHRDRLAFKGPHALTEEEAVRRLGLLWDRFGRRNPFGAILTGPSGELSEWDADAFFETGRRDAGRFMEALSRIAPYAPHRRALDFGCGVGRMTRYLAAHFESVVGVDVAPAMIERARALNAELRNCEFVVNREPQLSVFATGSFDVVCSRLVLQHIPPRLVRRYIPELIRVLSPGGALMFQLPVAFSPLGVMLHGPVLGGRVKQSLPGALVRAYRVIKYLCLRVMSGRRMRMSGIPFEEVSALIAQSGGRLLTAVPDGSHGIPTVAGFEYWVSK